VFHELRTKNILGRAIAHAVSRRLPTAAARFRAQVRSRGIYGGQSGTGSGFLRVLRFPLPVLIPQSSAICTNFGLLRVIEPSGSTEDGDLDS
jgi:hypothetical protein